MFLRAFKGTFHTEELVCAYKRVIYFFPLKRERPTPDRKAINHPAAAAAAATTINSAPITKQTSKRPVTAPTTITQTKRTSKTTRKAKSGKSRNLGQTSSQTSFRLHFPTATIISHHATHSPHEKATGNGPPRECLRICCGVLAS